MIDVNQSCVNTRGSGIDEGIVCVTLYVSVLFEFPPVSITLRNKFKIPCEITVYWSSVFVAHIMAFKK